MARGANFYYAGDQNLGAALGQRLGQALFGDPDAAAKLALQRAQMDNYGANAEESRAHVKVYDAQAADQAQKTGGAKTLSDLFHGLAQQQPVPVVHVGGPPSPGDEGLGAAPPVGPDPNQIKAALPSMIAAMALARGDNVPVAETLAQLPAYFGGDELARRSLIAQGHTPTNDFALTPQRADDISARDAGEDLTKAVTVEDIQSGDRRRGQDLEHGDRVRGQNVESGDRRRGQDLSYDASVYKSNIGKTVGFSLVSSVLPGARMTGGERDPKHNREVGGVSDSYHLPGDGVEAFDIAPGTGARTFADAKAAMQKTYGGRLIEAIDETHRPGHGPHWHFAIADEPGGGKAKAPKQISAASAKMLDGEITQQLKARGWGAQGQAMQNIRISAQKNFQQSGNAADAVSQALAVINRRMASRSGGDVKSQAMAAIQKGADPDAVRARYKQMTGQELGS